MPLPNSREFIRNAKEQTPEWVKGWTTHYHSYDNNDAMDTNFTDNYALNQSRNYLSGILESTLYNQRLLGTLELHLHNISDSLEKISNHMCLMETLTVSRFENHNWADKLGSEDGVDEFKKYKDYLEVCSSALGGYATQPPLP